MSDGEDWKQFPTHIWAWALDVEQKNETADIKHPEGAQSLLLTLLFNHWATARWHICVLMAINQSMLERRRGQTTCEERQRIPSHSTHPISPKIQLNVMREMFLLMFSSFFHHNFLGLYCNPIVAAAVNRELTAAVDLQNRIKRFQSCLSSNANVRQNADIWRFSVLINFGLLYYWG